MTLRQLLKISFGLILIFLIIVGLISRNHPIILKWLAGSARVIGKPINATVYSNGQLNTEMKVFHVDKYWDNGGKADYYILFTSYAPKNSKLKFFCINRKDNYVGRPNSTSDEAYDFLFGQLFQSDIGGHFADFRDDIKGYDFDPKLTFKDRQIILNIPSTAKELKCDSLRVLL